MSEVRKRRKSRDTIKRIQNETEAENSNKVKEQILQKSSPVNSLRIISSITVILSLLTIVYFSNKDDNFNTFAKQSAIIPGKILIIDCSTEYLQEINKFDGCRPDECKRIVTDKIVSVSEVKEVLEIAKKGLKLGGSAGGASILDLHSGALSLGRNFVNIYKIDKSQNVFQESDFNIYRIVKEKMKYAVALHFKLNPESIYLTHPTFFSEITSKEAMTIHDEYWHPHVDKETYKSFHYTTLLYLNDYNIDFKGGRFVFIGERSNRTIEPKSGRVSIFTSGKENLHYVEKVQSGTRYAMTISFTCDKQYAIEDPNINKYEQD